MLKKRRKNKFGFGKKSFGSTEIGPWFRFPIPKPGFSRTLGHVCMHVGITFCKKYFWYVHFLPLGMKSLQ